MTLAAEGVDLSDADAAAQSILGRCADWASTMRGVSMRGTLGAPDWLAYEMRIWTLGETLRQLMKKDKRWRGVTAILEAAAKVVRCAEFGKGRQTFVLLLGDYGDKSYSSVLGDCLRDAETRGHALKSLTKLGAEGFDMHARRIALEDSGWIRTAAKRYLSVAGSGDVQNPDSH